MSDSYILYVCDTETTGIEVGKHEIIELSLIRLVLDDSEKCEQKTWKLRALKPETISEEALLKNGHKREDILCLSKYGRENYHHPNEILPEIENWIAEDNMSAHDRVLGGQNIEFDYEHMFELWKEQQAEDTFPFTVGHNKLVVDTKHLAIIIDLCVGRKRELYNLSALVKAFGVKKQKAHRAETDTIMTKDLLVSQLNGIKAAAKEAFESCYK